MRIAAGPAIAVAGATALALLAAACGGSRGSHAPQLGPSTVRSAGLRALEYSRCMRSHGVPKFPDLTRLDLVGSGAPKVSVSMERLGVTSSEYQAAQTACAQLLPNGGRTTPTQSQQDLRAMRGFASCMRSHGLPTWPDPADGPAGWGFDLVHVQGFDPNSSEIEHKMDVCQRRLPPGVGVPLSRPGRPG
jgi:hypothetical protein